MGSHRPAQRRHGVLPCGIVLLYTLYCYILVLLAWLCRTICCALYSTLLLQYMVPCRNGIVLHGMAWPGVVRFSGTSQTEYYSIARCSIAR